MRRYSSLTLLAALGVIGVLPVGYARGQVQAPTTDTLLVGSYVNANTPGVADGTVFIVNPGTSGGDLCADTYVFDRNGEMVSCCGCLVPQNGLVTLSINDDLTSNPLTGIRPTEGVIKVISAFPSQSISINFGKCDPRLVHQTPTLRGDREIPAKHQHNGDNLSSAGHKGYEMHKAPLSSKEHDSLENQCSVLAKDGSGQGICSCGTAD
ncbi:MAG TPA: hypothetical protein VMS64_35545 [Candidatus Methylomirabilis sp.]|nr:hypothetical protein [Candidatus Methylomirabilis sp.]